jgi:uncharacterized linocin/CFP29 family protein
MTNALATFSKAIDNELVDPLRQVLKGRQLVYVTEPKGFGVTSVDWGKITEMSDGVVSYGFTSGNEDAIDTTLTNSKVPVYWKDYTVDRRMYEGWLINNTDIDASSAISAGYKAAKAEDTAIVMGITRDGTNYDFTGLYTGAGNDFSSSKDFGTYGYATDAVAGGLALMADDGVPTDTLPINVVLAPTQYGELSASESANGVPEINNILRLLNGGRVYQSNALTAGTGFLAPTAEVGKPFVDFYLTNDFETDNGLVDPGHPRTSDISGRVFSAGILRIKQANAICKLSAI